MTKIQRNTHWSPKSSVRDQVPKVAMGEPLTPWRPEQSCLFIRSVVDGGLTLTFVLVSMRNRRPVVASFKNSRQLVGRPGSLVAASDWPDRFPTFGRVTGISWLRLHISSDTSRAGHLWPGCVIFTIGVVQDSLIRDGGMSLRLSTTVWIALPASG